MRIIILFIIKFYLLLIIVFLFHRYSLAHNTSVQINDDILMQNTSTTQEPSNLYNEKNKNTSKSYKIINRTKKEASMTKNYANKILSSKKQLSKKTKLKIMDIYTNMTLNLSKTLNNLNENNEKKQNTIFIFLEELFQMTKSYDNNKFIKMTEITILNLVKNLKPEELNNEILKIAYKLHKEENESERKNILIELRECFIRNDNQDMAERDKIIMN